MLTGWVRNRMSALGDNVETCFRLTFADGSHYQNRGGAPAFDIVIRRARAQWRILLFGHIGLMESYFDGDVDVNGEFATAFQVAFESGFERNPNVLIGLRNRWHELRRSNRSIAQARANARFHYAIGTEFYRYWLDTPLMMYTCGYWKEGTTSVDEAQINKVDHVCRKIKLSRGETVIDIGCGFGGFMFHAHDRYDAAVLEHAGRDQLAQVVKAHADFLKPGGMGMLHFIGHVGVRDTEFYIREHVFPGGWIPSLAETIVEMERCGLEIVDIENLRRHYAPTLDAWVQRFDRNWESIRVLDPRRFNEKFRRVWRTYLISCAEMFRSPAGITHLFQIVFSKGNVTRDNYPMSRSFLYEQR